VLTNINYMTFLRFNISWIFIFISVIGNAQTTKYKIEEVGSIEISDILELQSKTYAKEKIKWLAERSLPAKPKTVFQQAGLNAGDPTSRETYARLILEIEYGEFVSSKYNPADDPEADIPSMCDAIHQYLKQSFSGGPLKFESFGTCNVPQINGNYAIYYSYTRSYPPNAPVFVEVYIFQNSTRKVTLTLSYRIEDSYKWKAALEEAVQSFKLP